MYISSLAGLKPSQAESLLLRQEIRLRTIHYPLLTINYQLICRPFRAKLFMGILTRRVAAG
ncbi:MAG: hypothetical protein LBU34_02040 [Planctomycetaceae bacterium]|nr:hypothetical protein [Planctomycetaceae bacterium]